MQSRYWVHGDITADGLAYFDGRADSFCLLPLGRPVSAFDIDKYKRMLKHTKHSSYPRPADAPNLFSADPLLDVHHRTLARLIREGRSIEAIHNPPRVYAEGYEP